MIIMMQGNKAVTIPLFCFIDSYKDNAFTNSSLYMAHVISIIEQHIEYSSLNHDSRYTDYWNIILITHH